ncbi:MAG TPA: hypothetical protein PKV75_06285, partial [Desulfobacterales bacterium]|nr:hypothetical protein [Desulfobacterales bacterium]
GSFIKIVESSVTYAPFNPKKNNTALGIAPRGAFHAPFFRMRRRAGLCANRAASKRIMAYRIEGWIDR